VVGAAWACCLVLLTWAGEQALQSWDAFIGRCAKGWASVTTWAGCVWRFRRTCAMAAGVGVCCGAVAYCSGPLVSAGMCVGGGVGLTVSALILVPLGRLLLSGYGTEA
jgi:hypothetical protein